jgi:osmotically-inducible protein OsmY
MKLPQKNIGVSLLLGGLLLVTAAGCNKSADETADTTAEAGANAAQAGANAADNAGDAAGNAAKDAGDAMSDAAGGVTNAGVTAKVKNAINMSPAIDNTKSKVNVDTKDDQVILRGTVATAKEKQVAEQLAKANAGTRKVVNQLTVGANAKM